MKKLIVLFILIGFTLPGLTQTPFKGFFRAVPTDLFPMQYKSIGASGAKIPGIWLFRPAVELTAISLSYDKVNKEMIATPFNQGGLGVSYQHLILVNDLPYTNFGLNLFALYNDGHMGGAFTLSALQYWNIGIAYDFGIKKVFYLTGITYSFNK